jgi:hypothetical protein
MQGCFGDEGRVGWIPKKAIDQRSSFVHKSCESN